MSRWREFVKFWTLRISVPAKAGATDMPDRPRPSKRGIPRNS
jgi:hypothetical protein